MHQAHTGAEDSTTSIILFTLLYLFYIVLNSFYLALIETSYFLDQNVSLCFNEIL